MPFFDFPFSLAHQHFKPSELSRRPASALPKTMRWCKLNMSHGEMVYTSWQPPCIHSCHVPKKPELHSPNRAETLVHMRLWHSPSELVLGGDWDRPARLPGGPATQHFRRELRFLNNSNKRYKTCHFLCPVGGSCPWNELLWHLSGGQQLLTWRFQKNWGAQFGSPYDNDHNSFGSVLWPPSAGNSHIKPRN